MEKNENNDARYERERGKESDMVLMFDCCLRAGAKDLMEAAFFGSDLRRKKCQG